MSGGKEKRSERGGCPVVWVPALLMCAPLALAGTPRCAPSQPVTVDERSDWRCALTVEPAQAFLIRAVQSNLDVAIAIDSPGASRVPSVNAPTRRATPELLLVEPRVKEPLHLVVSAVDAERDGGEVLVSIERISGTDARVPGLRHLTNAAASVERSSAASAERNIAQLRTAVSLFKTAGEGELAAEAQFRIASAYYWAINDWAKAASEALAAMDAYAALKDPVMRSQAAILRSASQIETAFALMPRTGRVRTPGARSQFVEPMELLAEAATQLQGAGRRYDEAQAINYIGIAHYYQGQYEAARARYQEAADIYARLGDRRSGALPLQNIAMIDFNRGDYARAIQSYDSLLRVMSPSENAVHYVAMLLNRATAQYVLGDFDVSLDTFLEALKLSEEQGFLQEEARSLHGLGMVYLLIGERERAEAFLQRALAIRRQQAAQNPRGLQISLLQVGNLERESGDVAAALKLHAEALERAMTLTQKALAFSAIGLDHEASNSMQPALQAYEAAMRLGLAEDSPVQATIKASYGRARLETGDPDGRGMVIDAARTHEQHGESDLAAHAHLALARHHLRAGRIDASLAGVAKALKLYESDGIRAVNPDLRATYLANRSAAFELQTDAYMAKALQAKDAGERKRFERLALLTTETNRQGVLEDFRQLATSGKATGAAAEILALDRQIAAKRHRLAMMMEHPNAAADELAALREDIGLLRTKLDVLQQGGTPAQRKAGTGSTTAESSLKALQAGLAADAVIIVYQLGEERSWAWAVTRQGISAFQLRARADVEHAARELYTSWSRPDSVPDGFERELIASRILLGPLTPALRGKRSIAVVADGALRSVPFAALWTETRPGVPERLLATHAITFRPSLEGSAPGARTTATGNRILLVGDPTMASPAGSAQATDPWALQPLPGSRREVQEIAGIARGWSSYVLLGAEATKPALLSIPLESFRAIHLATHARLDVQDPQLSAIALSTRDVNRGSLGATLTVREIVGFKLQAQAVVLSACEASLGKNYRGQLSFGLSEAFLLAGARNVLGSLWRVSDDAAQAYMRHFYANYILREVDPVAASQAAAIALSRDPQYSHPYFWAAFVVTQR